MFGGFPIKIKTKIRKLFIYLIGDSNEAKIRVAEYSTILFQQGQFLSRVRPTKFKANIYAKIERY